MTHLFKGSAKIADYLQSDNFVENSVGLRIGFRNGTFENYGSTPGQGAMKQTNQTISSRDENGVVLAQFGKLTGVW